MNDATPTPDHDDLLRRALAAEAEHVEASDALLDRTLQAASRPAVRPGRRLLAAAAVAAVAIGAGVALTRDDGEQQIDSANDPTTTTEPIDGLPDLLGTLFPCDDTVLTQVYVAPTASDDQQAAVVAALTAEGQVVQPRSHPAADVEARLRERYARDSDALAVIDGSEIPSAVVARTPDPDVELELRAEVSDLAGVEHVSSVDCRDGAVDAPRPAEVVAVLDDGRLVALDVASGEIRRELHRLADPRESEGAAEPDPTQRAITDAVLSPDGETVYFGTSGGDGGVYRMPFDGSAEPERLTDGWGPSVANDGRFFVFATYDQWGVYDLATGRVVMHDLPEGEASPLLRLSPDGTEVEVVSWNMDAAVAQVQRVHTLGADGSVAKTVDGFATWGQATNVSDGTASWVLKILESDDGSTSIAWGPVVDGIGDLTEGEAIPNPDGLVVRTADW